MKKIAIISLSLLLFLTGCKDDFSVEKSSSTVDSTVQVDTSYPREISNYTSKAEPKTFVVQKKPKRIVAVWQNSIETILALGAGDSLVCALGLPDVSHLREEYRPLYEKILRHQFELLDMEGLTMVEPDFILGWFSTFGDKVFRSTDYWNERGVLTYIAPSSIPRRVAEVPANTIVAECNYIEDIGKIVGKEEKAHELVTKMQAKIASVEKYAQTVEKKPRAIVIEFLGKNISVYGKKRLAGNIVESLAGDLIDRGEDTISFESLIEENPEVIFVVLVEEDYAHPEVILARLYENKALYNVDAIKHKRVYPLPLYAIYSAGIRTQDGIELVARGLYPDMDN